MIRRLFKALLPRRGLQVLRDLGRLESGARWTYVRLAIQRRLGRTRPHVSPSGRTVTVVAICHGNILRSAFAEARLREAVVAGRLSPHLRISSAGLHAWPGKAADPRGVDAARELGTDLSRHRARLLDEPMVDSADLLLVMDRLNEAEMVSRYPAASARVVLLGELEAAPGTDPVIADPYSGNTNAVRQSYGRVAAAVDGLVDKLRGR